MEKYDFIKEHAEEFEVVDLCKAMSVSRTAFYRYTRGETYMLKTKRIKQRVAVREVFWEHKRRYGSRRVSAALKHQGIRIGRFKARSLMKEQDLKAIQPRSFVPKTTDNKHNGRISPNLLLDRKAVEKPNEVWVSDITYLPLSNGKWAYLGAWIDVYSRTIVGWKVADNMKDVLVYEPLLSAIKNRKPPEGLIIHSDRGRQYSSDEFRKIVKRYKLTQSMSRTKNPYDNAFAESLWGRLKNELLENGQFMSLEDARTEVFEYIEIYRAANRYNRKRLHSALEYNTPVHFETQYYNNSVN